MASSLPNPQDLVSFGHAAAGHAGTMSDEDGKLFIKPCVEAEIEFYNEANKNHQELAALMPTHMGDLTLMDPKDERINDTITDFVTEAGGAADKEQIAAVVSEHVDGAAPSGEAKPDEWVPTKGGKIKTNRAVVLENNTAGFTKPNILDLKLGVRLWADDAPEKKKTKFDKISEETTHKHFGFRMAGMRQYKGSDDPAELDEEGYLVHDKDYGRFNVNDDNLISEIKKFAFNDRAGIDKELGETVCAAFWDSVDDAVEVLEKEETRMYSASLLFVFEGDGKVLEKSIELNNEYSAKLAEEESIEEEPALEVRAGIKRAMEAGEMDDRLHSNKRVDSGIGMDEEVESAELPSEFPLEMISESILESPPPVFSVKLIDMAHATFVPGQGPDENMLKGVRSVREIFATLAGPERIEKLAAAKAERRLAEHGLSN